MADAVQTVFRPGPPGQWEANFFDALETVMKHETVEPLVRVLFLKNLIDAGKQGSLAFDEATRPLVALVEHVNVGANWLSPGEAVDDHWKAASVLKQMPPLTSMRKRVQERIAAMQQVPAGRHRWVGWLARVESGDNGTPTWRCLAPDSVAGSGNLVVIFQPRATGPISLPVIGHAEKGMLIITERGGEALVEGRPVFLAEN
jgi:hypothetical protein